MFGIRDLLDRYTRFAPPDTAARRALSESIQDVMGVEIDHRTIKMIGTVAYINVDTSIKSALFIRKPKVLERVEERLGRRAVTELR